MTENSATTCLRSHDLSRYQGQAFPGDEEILQLLQQMPCLLRPHENDNKADTKNPSPVFDLSLPSDVEPGSAEQMDPAWFVNVVVTVTDRNGCVIYHEAHFPKNPWLRNGIKNFVDLRWGDFVHPPDMEIWNQHLFEAFHEADRWRAARLAASQTPPSPSGTSNTFLLFTTAGPITSGEEHTIRRRRISSGGPSSSGSSTGGHQQHVVSTTSRLSPDMTDLKTVEALLHRRFIVSPLYRAHWGCPGGHGSVFYFRTVSLPFLRHQSCEEDDTGKTGRSRGHKSSSSSSTSNSSGTTETIGVFSPTSSFENLLLMSYHCILGKVPEDALLEAVGSGETTVFDPATLRVSEKPTDLIKSSNCIASPLDDLTRAFCFGSILDEDFDSSDQTSGRSKNPSEMIAQDPRSPSGAATTFTNSNGSSSSSNSHLAPADIDWIDQSLESLQQLEQRPPGEATFAAAESNPASQVCSSKHGRDLVGGGREHPDAGVDGMIAGTSSRSPRSSVTAELSKATCQNDRISIFLGLLLPEAIREIKEAVSAEPDMVARRVRAIVTRHLGPEILSKFFSSSNSTNHQWQQQRQDQSISPGSFAGATTSTVASTSTPTTLTATSVASSVKTTTTPTTSAGQQWMTPEPRDVANSFDEGMDQVASALVSPPPPPLAPPASTSAATAPASNRSHSSTTAPHPLLKESLSAPSGVFSQPPKRPSLVQELSVSSENAVGGEGDCASAPPPPPPPGFYESFSSKSRTAPTPSGQTSGTTTPASFDSMSGTSPWMHRSSTTQLPALPPSTNSQSHPPSAPAPRIPKNTSSASSTSSSSSQEVHSTAGVLESLLMGGYVAPDSSRPRRISGSSASSAAATTMRQRNASEATGGGLSLSLAECQPTLSNSGPSSACCPVPKVPGTSMSFAFEIDEWPMVSSSSGSRGSPSRTTRTATNASRGSRVSQVLVSPNSASSCSSLAHLLRHGCPPSTTDNSGPSVAPSAMATAGATATTTTTTTATTTTTSTTVAAAAVVTTGGSISSPVVVSSPALLTTACATRANRIASRQQLQEQAPPPPPTAPTNRTSPQSRPLDCPLSIIVDPQPQQPLAPNSSKNLLIPSHSSMLSGSYDDAKLSLTAMTTTGSTEPTMTSIPRRTQSPPKTIYGPDFATCMPTKAEFLLYHPPNSQQRSHQGYYQRQQQLNSAQPPPPPPRKKSREDEEAIMANSSLCRLLQAPDPNWDTLTIEVDAAAAQEVWDPSSSTTAPPTVPPPPPPSFANLPPDLLVANDFNQLQHQTRGLDHQRQMNTMANTPPNHGSASSTSAAMMEASVASPANLESNRRAAAVAAAQIAEEAESQSRHLSNAHNCYEGTQGMGPMSQKGLGTTNANNRCRPAQSQGNAPICYSSGSDSSGGTSNPGSLELLQPASCSTNLNAGEPDALVDFDMISVVLPPTIPPPPSQQQQQTTTAVASSSRLEDFSRRLKEIAPNVSVSPSRSQHQQNQCQQNPRQQLPQQQQQPPPPPPPPAMYANENHNHLQQQQQHSNHQNLHSQGYQQQKTQPSQQIVQMQPPPPSYEFSGGHLAPVTYDYQDSQNLGGQSRYQRYQPPPQQQQQQVVTCNAPAPQGHYHQQQQQSMPPPPPQYASHQKMAAIQPKMAQHHPHPHAQYHQHQSSYYHHQNPPIAGYHHHQQQQHLQERRYGYEEAPPQPPPQYGYQQGGHQHHHHGSHQHPSALLMQQQLHHAMPPQRAQPNYVSPLTMALQQNQTQQHAQVKVNLRKKVTGRCQPRSNVEPSVAASGGVPGGYGVAANGNAVAPPQPPSPACLRTGQKRSHPSEEYYYAPQSRQAQQQQQPPPPPAPAYRQPFDTAQPVGVMDNSVAMEEMPFTDPAGAYDFCDAPVTPSQHDFNSMVFVNAPDTSQHQMMLQRQQYPPASNCRLDNIKAVSASDVCTSSISHLNDDIQLTDDIVNDVLDLEGLL